MENRHIQREDIYREMTNIEKRHICNVDIYGEGTYTEKRHIEKRYI